MAAYNAITKVGVINIGDFDSYEQAYSWAAQRYGNDFMGVENVAVVKTVPPVTGEIFPSWLGIGAIVALGVWLLSKNK